MADEPPRARGGCGSAVSFVDTAKKRMRAAPEYSADVLKAKGNINLLLDVKGAACGSLAPSLPAPASKDAASSSGDKPAVASAASAFKQHRGRVTTKDEILVAHDAVVSCSAGPHQRRSLTRRRRDAHWREAVKTGKAVQRLRDKGLLSSSAGQKQPCCLVDPRRSMRWLQYWDVASITALLYVAIVTPYETAFLPPAKSMLEPVFVINQVVAAIFLFDFLLQFNLIQQITTRDGDKKWVSDRATLVRHYLHGWMLIDLVSIAVSFFDFLPFIVGAEGARAGTASPVDLKLLRVLRTLKIVRMVKLLTGSRVIRKYEVRVAINYAMLSLMQCIGGLILLSHWYACIWGLQAVFQNDRLETWLANAGPYCWADATSLEGVACVEPWRIYFAGLYWAVMTITSIGYGDVAATAGNTVEQIVATSLMIVGSMVWGLILGTIVTDLNNLDPESKAFRNTMSELNRMMVREELPREMRVRLREYFHQTHHIRTTNKRHDLLELMSPALRSEVAWEVNKRWLSRVWFLEGASLSFLVQLALVLKPVVFAPGEIAPIGPLYIVNRGLALYGGMVYVRGSYFGEDVILTSQHLQHTYCALAMNFLEVFVLARQDLEDVAAIFPAVWKQIRQHAVRLACRRAFILEAQTRKASAADLFAGASKRPGPPKAVLEPGLEAEHSVSAASACAAAVAGSHKRMSSRNGMNHLRPSSPNLQPPAAANGDALRADAGVQPVPPSSSPSFNQVLSSVLGGSFGGSSPSKHDEQRQTAGAAGAEMQATLTAITGLRNEISSMMDHVGRGQAALRKGLQAQAEESERRASMLKNQVETLQQDILDVKAWLIHGTLEKLRA